MKITAKVKKFFRKRYARLAGPAHFRAYLARSKTPRLHLGCGVRVLEGWLNTDFFADPARDIIFQDLTRPFPCPDRCFDLVYSEHVQEHFEYQAGKLILSECYRVLRPGGVLSLATPDLDFYLRLYQQRAALDEKQRGFFRYFLETFDDFRGYPGNTVSALNGIFYGFGHRFIFSEDCLVETLREAGFREVKKVQAGVSAYAELSGLELNPQFRNDAAGNNALEYHLMANLSVEARK